MLNPLTNQAQLWIRPCYTIACLQLSLASSRIAFIHSAITIVLDKDRDNWDLNGVGFGGAVLVEPNSTKWYPGIKYWLDNPSRAAKIENTLINFPLKIVLLIYFVYTYILFPFDMLKFGKSSFIWHCQSSYPFCSSNLVDLGYHFTYTTCYRSGP